MHFRCMMNISLQLILPKFVFVRAELRRSKSVLLLRYLIPKTVIAQQLDITLI